MDEPIKVDDVVDFGSEAAELYHDVVEGEGDALINDLRVAIGKLRQSWNGTDANTQINNAISVLNDMVKVRNVLADLSKDASVAANDLCELQQINKGDIADIEVVNLKENDDTMAAIEETTRAAEISDDTRSGEEILNDCIQRFGRFKAKADTKFDKIMSNWHSGPGRKKAIEAYEEFKQNADSYKKKLVDADESVKTAIQNYAAYGKDRV